MSRLVNELIKEGYLKSDEVINAFSKVHRMEFVPDDLISQAEANIPLPIGHGQTISQPLTVAFMMELLDPRFGQNILDIGSGSGWTTGLLAHIVGDKGSVVAIEKIKELCEFATKNLDKFGFIKKGIVEFYCQSGEMGYEKKAPFDRILVSASVKSVPEAFKNQLAIGGKMVIPINNEIWYMEKISSEEFKTERFPGFVFVPFVTRN